MGKCIACNKESLLISSPLEVCVDCIRSNFTEVRSHIERMHARSRSAFGLPIKPPSAEKGLGCNYCINQCQISEQERGYCGLRINRAGKFEGGRVFEGNFVWYYDPLPTNCVAAWVCPAGTGCGYPEFSYCRDIEYGYKNLAVFFNACTFNCLFCQNWHYRENSLKKGKYSSDELVDAVDEKTACICYFGGDPTPQLPYAIRAARLSMKKRKGKILRICWETNGSMNSQLLKEITDISLKSGGCIKFDLKAWNEGLHIALCGISNKLTLSNFEYLAKYIHERPTPPFLIASTLLVPGYIDEEEVNNISKFIASLNPDIPYSLLGFYPRFYMSDLPPTSRKHAESCMKVAMNAGLKMVTIGNMHLLKDDY